MIFISSFFTIVSKDRHLRSSKQFLGIVFIENVCSRSPKNGVSFDRTCTSRDCRGNCRCGLFLHLGISRYVSPQQLVQNLFFLIPSQNTTHTCSKTNLDFFSFFEV